MDSLNYFSRLRGLETVCSCLLPDPGETRVGEWWPGVYKGLIKEAVGVKALNFLVCILKSCSGQSVYHLGMTYPWEKGSPSRVNKTPDVKRQNTENKR